MELVEQRSNADREIVHVRGRYVQEWTKPAGQSDDHGHLERPCGARSGRYWIDCCVFNSATTRKSLQSLTPRLTLSRAGLRVTGEDGLHHDARARPCPGNAARRQLRVHTLHAQPRQRLHHGTDRHVCEYIYRPMLFGGTNTASSTSFLDVQN